MEKHAFEITAIDGAPGKITGELALEHHAIAIRFDGYGGKTSQPGHGAQLVIEAGPDGHPVIHVWTDVNEEEPTTISLAAASELNRPVDDLGVLATVIGNLALNLASEPVQFAADLVKQATHFEVRAEGEDGPVFYYVLWRGRQKLAVAHAPAGEFFGGAP